MWCGRAGVECFCVHGELDFVVGWFEVVAVEGYAPSQSVCSVQGLPSMGFGN